MKTQLDQVKEREKEPADLTLEQFCNYVAPGVWDQDLLLTWPPDVFAVVASLLLKSGAYSYAVSKDWKRGPKLKPWVEHIENIGKEWGENHTDPPKEVHQWHRTLTSKRNRSVPLSRLRSRPKMCEALLDLSAASDEASAGVGLGQWKRAGFLGEASFQLWRSTVKALDVSTLCTRVHPSVVRILPKLHTPQSGMTIRSLTHNLALCPAGDVKAKWTERLTSEPTRRYCLNLLLVPWPRKVNPLDFQAVPSRRAELRPMPERFRFFEYKPPRNRKDDVPGRLKNLLTNAENVVSRIDGVVFPELALTRAQCETISRDLIEQNVFLVCGVRGPRQNYLRFDIPFDITVGRKVVRLPIEHEQRKHHRWRLDKRQIVQYGLGSCLSVEKKWWEHISIKDRELNFVVLDDGLTVCALICEDLARQDPVAEVVRAVGPNLVIALLMDGPQLKSRWPARYATVLADDPGSSVLTLTSIGMCELSRPPSIKERSRAVALWKDAKSDDAVEIHLPPDADGVILSLSCIFKNEWAADGRDDAGSTGYPILSGMHFVSSQKPGSH